MNTTFRNVAALAFFASCAGVGYISAGHAAETKEVTRKITIYTLKDDAPAFYQTVKAICEDKGVKLSDKAKLACLKDEFPSITKALKFRNAGIGAEFNTLANQR